MDESEQEYIEKNGVKNTNVIIKKQPLDPEFTPPPPADKTKAASAVSFRKLFRYATIRDRIMMFFAIVCAIIAGCVLPMNSLLFADLSNAMINYGMSDKGPEAADEFHESVMFYVIGNVILGTILLIFSYIATVLMNYTALNQVFKIKWLYLQSALNQDVAWYDTNKTGDFASKMAEDLVKMQDGMGEKITNFLHLFVSFLSSYVMALVKGWQLALVSMISFPLTMILMTMIVRVVTKCARMEAMAYSRAAVTAEEVLSSIRTVFAFNGQHKEVDRFGGDLLDAKGINIKKALYMGIGLGILYLVIYGSYGLSFWYGIELLLTHDHYTPDVMVAVFFGVVMGTMQVAMSTPLLDVFAVAKGSAAKIFSLIDQVPKINPLLDEGIRPANLHGNITLENIYFNYPSRSDVQVLRGVSLTIKKGQTVALVGTSGCGKSTIIQLIQRFYDPLKGTVRIDDNDIQTLSIQWLRSKIGVVGQEPILFNTSIKNNIRYGYQSATDEEIYAAAKKANAHKFIKQLPSGYDSLCGDRGAQLSGGQKQRIAIARALVRDPQILLLDEATSALDTNSEATVQRALDKAREGRTTIIVAHRLTTIRTADIIFAFKNGVVAEFGSHDQLMLEKGVYYEMVMTQSSPQQEEKRELMKRPSVISQASTLKSIGKEDETADELVEGPSEPFWKVIALSKPEWKEATVACICSFLVGCAQPSFAIILGQILGVLSSDDPDEIRQTANMMSILFACIGVGLCITNFLQTFLYGLAGERLTERLRRQMFQTYLSQEIAWFDDKNNSTGALCARLSGEASAVQGATGHRIGTLMQAAATLCVAIGLGMFYEWRVGLVAGAFIPVIIYMLYKQNAMWRRERFTDAHANESSTKIAVDAVSNIRTVMSLGTERMFVELYMEKLQPALETSQKGTHARGFVYGMSRGAMNYAMATAIVYGGYLIINHDVAYENVVMTSQAMIMCTASVASALAFSPNFQNGLNSANRILQLFKRVPQLLDPDVPTKENFVSSGPATYTNIEFAYPTRPNTTVLQDMNLCIKPGQTVALVGASGCGKSTVIQLLERFYDPNFGTVTLENQVISNIRQADLRKNLGIVQQEPILFDRTIGANIAYGDNSRIPTQEEIIEAAKQANIHNFIASLPLGYETQLGNKGTQLSGGQKQRVAIARALLRNPKILLLDEATSALDVESEKVVQEALDNAKVGRTCIIIAHRLSTIKDADVICVFSEGKVGEMGTHSELMAKKGLFYKLQQQS